MNTVTRSANSSLRSALLSIAPYALLFSLSANVALGLVAYRLDQAADVLAKIAVEAAAASKQNTSITAAVPPVEVLKSSAVLESCKIKLTKYRSSEGQGDAVYWSSQVESCDNENSNGTNTN